MISLQALKSVMNFSMIKKNAGNAIINNCKSIGNSNEFHHIGSYRGFELYVNYEPFSHDFKFHLQGELSHSGTIGTDAIGNITRLDNSIKDIDLYKNECINSLAETEKQL